MKALKNLSFSLAIIQRKKKINELQDGIESRQGTFENAIASHPTTQNISENPITWSPQPK